MATGGEVERDENPSGRIGDCHTERGRSRPGLGPCSRDSRFNKVSGLETARGKVGIAGLGT